VKGFLKRQTNPMGARRSPNLKKWFTIGYSKKNWSKVHVGGGENPVQHMVFQVNFSGVEKKTKKNHPETEPLRKGQGVGRTVFVRQGWFFTVPTPAKLGRNPVTRWTHGYLGLDEVTRPP